MATSSPYANITTKMTRARVQSKITQKTIKDMPISINVGTTLNKRSCGSDAYLKIFGKNIETDLECTVNGCATIENP